MCLWWRRIVQNLAVLETRAETLGIEVRTAPAADLEFNDTIFGVLLRTRPPMGRRQFTRN